MFFFTEEIGIPLALVDSSFHLIQAIYIMSLVGLFSNIKKLAENYNVLNKLLYEIFAELLEKFMYEKHLEIKRKYFKL